MIFTVIGMTVFAGLSAMLYITLPASMWEEAARHGRFSGLGGREWTPGSTAGNAPARTLRAFQGQSV